ncbi:MAG: malto-oligosyltrehalose synthase [Thermoplasmata archaeon]
MDAAAPGATYRVQLSARFGFDRLRRWVPYLARLGIDTVYLSPITAARRGSPHGYDGVDPGRLDPSRGGAAGFRRLGRALDRHGMRLLLDVVPNHVAGVPENRAWWDVLRRGPGSPYAAIFDIDWDRTPDGRAAVVLPWLDRELPDAFRDGALAFERTRAGLRLRWRTTRLPGSARLERRWRTWNRPGARRTPKNRPGALVPSARALLERVNRGSTPPDRTRRDALLADLWYRLVPSWDVGAINYRHFADVAELVGVRADEPAGFAYAHRWLLRAARAGRVAAVRVDHVDGLADPLAYLRRLRAALRDAGGGRRPPYVVVEKILARDESLPTEWPVAGTTGYDALARITGVLSQPVRAGALDAAYRRACPDARGNFADGAYRARAEVAERMFPGDRAELLRRLAGGTAGRVGRPDPAGLDRALVRLTAALSIYRTYARVEGERAEDRRQVRAAFAEARRRAAGPRAQRELDALERRWRARGVGPPGRTSRSFRVRWQQWCPAVAAKGVEDTAFYRYPRFLAANEVGADPGHPDCPLEEFHAFMQARARHWPGALTATSTHDSKWGEDARARLAALSEWGEPWGESARRWARGAPRAGGKPVPAPDAGDAYRLFQTLVASAPARHRFSPVALRRLTAHTVKAAREAKRRTSWTRPNRRYESRIARYLEFLFEDPRASELRAELSDWIDRLAFFGSYYSLAQVVLRTTVPGVPDLYQGSEGWNLSLVDPDNRRPVPFPRLERTLARSDAADPSGTGGFLPARRRAPAPRPSDKLALTVGLLRFRAARRTLFERGRYVPWAESGRGGPSAVLAFERRLGRESVVVVVGRRLAGVSGGRCVPPTAERWRGRGLQIPYRSAHRWRELLTERVLRVPAAATGARLPLPEVFADWPLALLYDDGRGHGDGAG